MMPHLRRLSARLAMLVMLPAAAIWAADGGADREYITALTEYQQAEIEHGVGDGEAARRHLVLAQRARARALAGYRASDGQGDPEVITRRCIELERLGKVCCGRVSLWDRYACQTESGSGRNQDDHAGAQVLRPQSGIGVEDAPPVLGSSIKSDAEQGQGVAGLEGVAPALDR